MATTRIAAAQIECDGHAGRGLERVEAAVAEAAAAGAMLVAFGETVLPGYPAWLDVCRDTALWDHPPVKRAFRTMAEQAVEVPGEITARLAATARSQRVVLVIGVVERVAAGPGRGTLYNSLLTFGADGTLLNHHRKLMPTHSERMVWGQGDAQGVRAVDTTVGRVGGLICWEHWMPLARQALHESGEDVHVAVWPEVREMLSIASRHYAFEGRCWVIAAGSVMRREALPDDLELHPDRDPGPDGWVLRGGSAIFRPDGSVAAGPLDGVEGLLFAEVDAGAVIEEHMSLDVAGHYSRSDCFRLVRVEGVPRGGGDSPPSARGTAAETSGAPAA